MKSIMVNKFKIGDIGGSILKILGGIIVISYFLIHVLLWATFLWMLIDLFIGGKK